MKDKILAIKGHATRGEEVIKILEMLGGNNKYHINAAQCNLLYAIREGDNVIIGTYPSSILQIYTLEEFLEKYPYKVGDKVQDKGSASYEDIYIIEDMIWENNQINYIVYNQSHKYPKCTVTAEYLQPYKEEIYTDNPSDEDAKTGITIDGEKLIAPNGYTVKTATMDGNSLIVEYIKNKPQYPKTFQECYALKYNGQINLNIGCDILHGAYSEELECLQNLLICRDVYWEIVWVEMGLSEPWKPNFGENFIYAIGAFYGTIQKTMVTGGRGILLFPTEEMRDAFYENFKDLIEKCKEFL